MSNALLKLSISEMTRDRLLALLKARAEIETQLQITLRTLADERGLPELHFVNLAQSEDGPQLLYMASAMPPT